MKIRLKKRKLTKPKPFIRADQSYALLELIAEPYATMVYVAVFTALRVSELAGMLWRNVHADSITIEQRYSLIACLNRKFAFAPCLSHRDSSSNASGL